MYSINFMCLYSEISLLQQISVWLKFSLTKRACSYKSSRFFRKALSISYQMVCHPYIAALQSWCHLLSCQSGFVNVVTNCDYIHNFFHHWNVEHTFLCRLFVYICHFLRKIAYSDWGLALNHLCIPMFKTLLSEMQVKAQFVCGLHALSLSRFSECW